MKNILQAQNHVAALLQRENLGVDVCNTLVYHGFILKSLSINSVEDSKLSDL